MPSRLKKALYRKVRYHPWTERLQNVLRRQESVHFDEIDLDVPARPGDIIIDAGANVGDVTSKCARTGATVHAFEPNPVCFEILKKRFSRLPNVRIYNQGVMDKPGSLTLSTPVAHEQYDDLDTTVAASFVAPKSGDIEMRETEVECIDLAELHPRTRSAGDLAQNGYRRCGGAGPEPDDRHRSHRRGAARDRRNSRAFLG